MDQQRVVSTTVLVELFASLVLFGELGALSVDGLSTWQDFVAWALAVMVLFTASAPDYTRAKGAFINMVPKASPNPRLLVRLAGVLEFLGRWGSLSPRPGV